MNALIRHLGLTIYGTARLVFARQAAVKMYMIHINQWVAIGILAWVKKFPGKINLAWNVYLVCQRLFRSF
jgi:hypothetical protein